MTEQLPNPPPQDPETYTFTPTPHVPNSTLPVLIYRSVLPLPAPSTTSLSDTVDAPTNTVAAEKPDDHGDDHSHLHANDPLAHLTRAALERNNWQQGGIFKHYPTAHFHSVTHEAYAIFRGASRMRLGAGPLDDAAGPTVEVPLRAGDVIVLPAGVAHRNVASEPGYTYAGLYPAGAPRYDNNWCRAGGAETAAAAAVAAAVPVPAFDPVYGRGGPLCRLWGAVKGAQEV